MSRLSFQLNKNRMISLDFDLIPAWFLGDIVLPLKAFTANWYDSSSLCSVTSTNNNRNI